MESTMDVRKGERVIAGLLCLLGGYVFWAAMGMPVGTFDTPGPGFFPRIVGLLLALSSIGIFFRRGEAEPDPTFSLREVAGCALILIVTAMLFKLLGALVSLGLMVFAMTALLGRASWWKAAAFGLGMSLFTWLVFMKLLGVQLPGGPF